MDEILEFLLNADFFVLSVALLCCSSVVLVGLLILAVKLQMLRHQLNTMSVCLNGAEKIPTTMANDFQLCGIPANHKVTMSEVNDRTQDLRDTSFYGLEITSDNDTVAAVAGSRSEENEPEYLVVIPNEEADMGYETPNHGQHNWKCHSTERCCNTEGISKLAEDEDGYLTPNDASLEEGTFPGKRTIMTENESINGTSPSAPLADPSTGDYPEYLTVIPEADIPDDAKPGKGHSEYQTVVHRNESSFNNNGRSGITSIPVYGNIDKSFFNDPDAGENPMEKAPMYVNQQALLQGLYLCKGTSDGDHQPVYANSEIQQESDVGNTNLAFKKDECPEYLTVVPEADIPDEAKPGKGHSEYQTVVHRNDSSFNNNGRSGITSIPVYGNIDKSFFNDPDAGENPMEKAPMYVNQQEALLQGLYLGKGTSDGDHQPVYANSEIQQKSDVGNKNLAFNKDECLPVYVNKGVVTQGSQ